ncbi:MAG: glutathione S-transferase [Hormoscilla sp.]
MYRYTRVALLSAIYLGTLSPARALPPPSDVPEEILRTEILTEARSPVDGKPLTAAEYALLQGKLQSRPSTRIDPQISELIFLLRIRRAVRTIIPF